jgi:hypothetical protein
LIPNTTKKEKKNSQKYPCTATPGKSLWTPRKHILQYKDNCTRPMNTFISREGKKRVGILFFPKQTRNQEERSKQIKRKKVG